MAAKKKAKNKQQKHHGQTCRVCGEHKANEKFSGKGHAAHICKKCHALPIAERNTMMAVQRAQSMAFRWLSDSEIQWLRKKMDDPRPEVRDAARASYSFKFPRHTHDRSMTEDELEVEALLSGDEEDFADEDWE